MMVDVTKHVAARAIYGISSVPTLRYFIKGRMEEEDYSGRRLAGDMLEATLAKAASRNISSSSSSAKVCMYVCVYMYTYIHAYIHTYIHTYMRIRRATILDERLKETYADVC